MLGDLIVFQRLRNDFLDELVVGSEQSASIFEVGPMLECRLDKLNPSSVGILPRDIDDEFGNTFFFCFEVLSYKDSRRLISFEFTSSYLENPYKACSKR